ncbi:MAG TPA: YigZ family protein [Clostridia bacterium]|nr:YigZ family protein [Clostridia bacterium]
MTPYNTVVTEAEDAFVEKRSRFICAIAPVQTSEQALAFIASRKEQHYDARHTVFAYILREGNVQRYSDDGEPQGTGGQPVLEVIRRSNLTDVCVAVTRYFGGILLGAGGLTRAYSNGAVLAIAAAEQVTMCPCADCRLVMDYSQYGIVGRLLTEYGIQQMNSDFGERVALTIRLKCDAVAVFEKVLTEATSATVRLETLGELFSSMPVHHVDARE